MSLLPAEQPRFEEMEQVVDLYIKNVNPTAIARELGIRRVDVLEHIDNWKNTAIGSELMQDRIEELIASMDLHYSTLINKFYEVVEEVDSDSYEPKGRAALLSQKISALRSIADLEAKRLDLLDKAGLRMDASVGDDLAMMEEQMELIMNIIDEELCSDCNRRVQERIHEYKSGSTVVIVND